MTFIRTIDPAEADGPVRDMYDQVERALGYVPNWARPFSLRPAVRDGWVALLASVKANLPARTFELATLAAARAVGSSYCSLAHGRILAEKVLDAASVTAIASGAEAAPLEPRERAMMAYAAKIARDASSITADDVDALRADGWSDEEIFDIAAAAAARCFFSKVLDALGVQADAVFHDLDPAMRDALTVGRPVAEASGS
jgi:uncharacterized peroxidase-related enzyme